MGIDNPGQKSGIDFGKTFGSGSASGTGSQEQRPTAKLWANIGYTVAGAGKDGADVFVSLPVGIPVDTSEKLATNSRSADYAELQAARNNLLDQFLAAGEKLAPGESVTVNLEIQLRRVNDERPAVTMTDTNRFARSEALVG